MLIPCAAWRDGTARTGTAPDRSPRIVPDRSPHIAPDRGPLTASDRGPLPAGTASLRPVRRPVHRVLRTSATAGRRP